LNFILQKLSIRLIVVLALLFILLLLSVLIIGLPLNERFLAYAVTAILYMLFWFAISFVVIALRRSSSISALLLLSTWVLFCLLIPAVVNNYLTVRYPVKEAYSTFIKQRDGYHNKWDKNPDSTMQAFFKHYPQFSHYKWESPKFNYMWYYAMQQLGDDESAPYSKAMHGKLQQRQHAAEVAAMLFMPMHAQLKLTGISGTDLSQQLQYLDSTSVFHENLKLHFYPKIFGDSAVTSENWKQHVPQYFKPANPIKWSALIMPFVLFVLVLGAGGTYIFNQNTMR
jgi:ABC-2 type transport system permease protein